MPAWFSALHSPAPSGQRLPFRESLLAMLGIAFVAMLVALDQTIVGTALPRIVADLRGFDLYAWVATAYMLASVITIPIFGRLGDLFGRKPFLIAAILLFTGASVLCGFASRFRRPPRRSERRARRVQTFFLLSVSIDI